MVDLTTHRLVYSPILLLILSVQYLVEVTKVSVEVTRNKPVIITSVYLFLPAYIGVILIKTKGVGYNHIV